MSAPFRSSGPRFKAYALLAFAMLAWGGNAVAGRLIVGEASPMAVTCLRWLIVVAALGAFAGRRVLSEWGALLEHWRPLLLMGAVGFTSFNALFYLAAHHTTAINLGLIQGIIPGLVIVGSFFVYGEPVGRWEILGVLLALVGVAVTTFHGDPDALRRLAFNEGDVMMLVGSMLYAGFVLALRRKLPASRNAVFAAMALAAFLTSVPLLGFEVGTATVQWPTARGWTIMVYIGLVPSLLSQLAFMRGVEMIGPARAGLFVNLIPVFAAGLGVLFLGEDFAAYHAVGLALVLGGIWVAERGRAKPEPGRSDEGTTSGPDEQVAVAAQQDLMKPDQR